MNKWCDLTKIKIFQEMIGIKYCPVFFTGNPKANTRVSHSGISVYHLFSGFLLDTKWKWMIPRKQMKWRHNLFYPCRETNVFRI